MTLLRRFWDAAVALDPAATDRDEGRSMPHCAPGELERLCRGTGRPAWVSESEAVVSASYDGFEDLWEPLERGVAPSGAYAASLPPDRRAALKQGPCAPASAPATSLSSWRRGGWPPGGSSGG